MGPVGTYNFIAEPFRCDWLDRLTMSSLGNEMINAADFQSAERDFGYRDIRKVNRAWVLSRFVIEMNEMPSSHDHYSISTWVISAMKFFTHRNWSVQSPEGKIYGYGTSVWAMIDLTTRQPADILSVNDGGIMQYVDKDNVVPITGPSRVRMDEKGAELISEIPVTYSDIDTNGHVNSVRYIEHVTDLFPLSWYEQNMLYRIEVAYVAESHFGDRLRFYQDKQSDNVYCFKISSVSPEGEEREACRIKCMFRC